MRHIRWVVMLLLLLPAAARGQVASGTDILRGRVTDESGAPVAGAEVEVWGAESGVRRTATTNGQGWYTVTVPDGGGRYRMRVSRLGMTPVERTVARTGDEEVLTQDIRMAGRPVEVGGVTARGRRPAPSTRADAGAQSRGLSSDLTSRLPLENTDPAALASLAPGVVATGDSLGGGGSFSVLGQRASQNQVTLDGATFASLLSGGAPGGSPLGLPQEGVRSTQVVTNTYDVARGQFSGGQVAMTTRAGGNTLQGSLSYRLGDDLLQGGAGRGAWTDGFMHNRLSGGVSGPIVRDKLFYALSVAGQQRSDGLYALAPRAREGFSVLGLSPDSAARFLDVAERVHGVSTAGQTGAFTRTGDALSTLARVDYSPTARHTLSARGYTSHSRTSNALIRPLELLEGGGASSSRAFGVVGTLSSRLGDAWINELRASASTDRREFTSALGVPEARVQVASALEAGTAVATLSFGGDPFPPRTTGERTLEVADELSLLLGGTHRVKLGATFGHTSFEQRDALGSNGIFTFASLADLEAGRAASYARTLAGATTEGSGWSAALYLGDTWRPTEGLQLVYGARVEGSGFGEAPAYNADADAAFGLRTDRTPSELRLSPRLGFSWRVPGGRPRFLRGGVGEFRGRTPFSLYAGVLDAGLGAGGESFLSCVGAGRVPEADFRRFRADPASVPTTCADGSAGVPASGGRPNVTAFAPGFEAPRSWRASLGYEHTLRQRLVLSVDGFYLRGLGQYGVRDLNLADAPAFTLDAEGGRPVYAPAATIDPRTGAVPLFGSRRDGRYAQAYEVHSGLRSESGAVTVALNGMLASIRTNFQTSYTLSYSRDQSSFTFGGPREGFGWTMTRGDPNEPEWAPGDQDRRHSLSAVVGRPFGSAWEVSLIGRATSGAPYTPRVAGDINGDGAWNDVAFVFDPADSSFGPALGRVMDAAPEHAAECLRENVGSVVRRNGCRGAWEYSLDTRIAFTPTLRTLGRRLSFGLDVRNLAAGADVLLHGSGGVRGWGQGGRMTDDVLLYPRGFDAATNSFRYQVNERFGQVRSRAAALGSPFTVQLTGRLQVGPNPEPDLWGGFMGLGGREGGVRIIQQLSGPAPEGAATGPQIRTGQRQGGPSMLDLLLPLPIADILARRDSLGLTPEQVERLEAIHKELEEKNIPIRAEVGAAMGGRGGAPGNPGAVFEKVGPRINQGRLNVQAALDQARAVLTSAQWEKVPLEVRNAVDGSSIRIQGT